MNIKTRFLFLLMAALFVSPAWAQLQGTGLLNEPTDISTDFNSFKNTYYFADSLASFNPERHRER